MMEKRLRGCMREVLFYQIIQKLEVAREAEFHDVTYWFRFKNVDSN